MKDLITKCYIISWTNRQNWLLCYNDCEFIRKHYSDYEIVPAEWAYGMNKSKKSNEVFIISRG